MRLWKRTVSAFLIVLLAFAVLPAAEAKTGTPVPTPVVLPKQGDYTVRIDGGYVSEHTETVNGTECLRVDLFLDGATRERMLSSISFKLLYDKDRLTYVKNASLSGGIGVINANTPGIVQFAFASASGTTLSGTTPLLTLWFRVAEGLPAGTQITFAFSEAIRADAVSGSDYQTVKCTVGARLKPFGIGPIWGDANCDCEVTAADASAVLRAMVGIEPLSEYGLLNAKVDGKTALSAEDAAWILRYVVGLIERFPIEG